MHNQPLIYHDNLDDKREIYTLLERLGPVQRVQFLQWACKQASFEMGGVSPVVMPETYDMMKRALQDDSVDRRLTYEIYLNLWQLASQFKFDLNRALQKLVEIVRVL